MSRIVISSVKEAEEAWREVRTTLLFLVGVAVAGTAAWFYYLSL